MHELCVCMCVLLHASLCGRLHKKVSAANKAAFCFSNCGGKLLWKWSNEQRVARRPESHSYIQSWDSCISLFFSRDCMHTWVHTVVVVDGYIFFFIVFFFVTLVLYFIYVFFLDVQRLSSRYVTNHAKVKVRCQWLIGKVSQTQGSGFIAQLGLFGPRLADEVTPQWIIVFYVRC